MYIVAFNNFGILGMANPKSTLESKATVMAASIHINSVQDVLHPLYNLLSQEIGAITIPAPLTIIVYSAIGLSEMANTKTALDSKTAAAVTSIRPSRRPAVVLSCAQYAVLEAQTNRNP